MKGPWFKIAALCSVLMAIVLFCVVIGGYSSFYRSQGRINDSADYLVDACKKRMQLLPESIEITQSMNIQKNTIETFKKALQKANIVLKQNSSSAPISDETWIRDFENTQEAITLVFQKIFTQDAAIVKNNDKQQRYAVLKKEIHAAQDYIFIVRQRYNKEVDYFKNRKTAFPGFLFARLFGFDKITYYYISLDKLLPAHKVFSEQS